MYLAAGILPNHSGAMAGWIAGVAGRQARRAHALVDRIDGATLSALAAYLEHLK